MVESGSPDTTFALGEALGRRLAGGDVILLSGELGSGKTRLAQGIAAGLGVSEPVKSSSFILLAEYQGRVRLYHADLYRLTSREEVADLALEEYARDGVLVVEWPERAAEELPAEHLRLDFEHAGETKRRIAFSAHGRRPRTLLEEVEGEWP
ncbi:MAG: tRNA (adenosine(37)-N6)-threonylcarbamoyltransferase complex ATPase subunit type 1 TsaE [Dehalococcoidia bacterium]